MKIKKSTVDAYFVLKDKGLIKKASDALFVGMDESAHIFKIVSAGVYVEVNPDIKTVSQTGKMFSVDMLKKDDKANMNFRHPMENFGGHGEIVRYSIPLDDGGRSFYKGIV